MCLATNLERRAGHEPSPRRTAWKMVQIKGKRRAPPYYDYGNRSYAKGTTHVVYKSRIEASRKRMADLLNYYHGLHVVYKSRIEASRKRMADLLNYYHAGLRVYTSREAARHACRWSTLTNRHIVVKVQVDPKDWIAEDTFSGEAIYSRLKVLT